MSLNAVSKHLQVLERAGLMRRTVRGREHHCALQAAPMREVTEWIERYRLFWEEQLDSLEEYLLRNTKPVKKPRRKKSLCPGELPPTQVRVRRCYRAARAVFAAWTNADSLKQWFRPGLTTSAEVELDVRPDGRFRIFAPQRRARHEITVI